MRLKIIHMVVFSTFFVLGACGRDPLQVGAHTGVRAMSAPLATANPYSIRWMEFPDEIHPGLDQIAGSLGATLGNQELLGDFYVLLGDVLPEEPAALLREAMHELMVRRGPDGTKRVFHIATELEKRFEGHPDQLYLSGYLRWVVIRAGNQINTSTLGQRARDDLKASWLKLLSIAPDYRGPQDIDAEWIRKQLSALD